MGINVQENKESCTGCRACEQVCLVSCINMLEDKEGFIYPIINQDMCIRCNKCLDVCPVNKKILKNNYQVYAGWNKNYDILMKSASGGIFTALALNILTNGGVVCGCAMNADLTVNHIFISRISDIHKLNSSKYVQSDTLCTYKEVKEKLEAQQIVLYSGTPCQIAGLKSYLGKEYEHLITIDILCHGVPSRKVFRKYIDYLTTIHKGSIAEFNFRDKLCSKYTRMESYVIIGKKRKKVIKRYMIESPYYYGFMKSIFLRPSCYHCQYSNTNRVGDISIGDFWGANNFHKEIKSDNGVSLIIVNNIKGEKILKSIKNKLKLIPSNIEYAKVRNSCLVSPVKEPSMRNDFFDDLDTIPFIDLSKKYLTPKHLKIKVMYYKLPVLIRKYIKKLSKKLDKK